MLPEAPAAGHLSGRQMQSSTLDLERVKADFGLHVIQTFWFICHDAPTGVGPRNFQEALLSNAV
jgi:hypothetical protein